MDLSRGTPQQIYDYKRSWMPKSYPVKLHSDADWKGKDWCRHNIERWQWSMNAWTDMHEHTFLFEFEEDADEFKEYFGKLAK